MEPRADIGLIGLAVMGQNLVLNMADHGFTVAVYNRTVARVDEFLAGEARGRSILGARSLPELVGHLRRPRRVMLLVRAGAAVDEFIGQLAPLLEPGDIVIDGGNSNYTDSIRRAAALEARGLLFVGTGVSGGEEGARRGPSLMPGGSPAAWPHIRPIFQAIAAKVEDGTPCCDWVGENGAGHYVKMVHNGIEYGDMQLIAEAYHVLREGGGLAPERLQAVFADWNRGPLESYLIEITADILGYREADGGLLLDRVLDAAGQKGTGKWTVVDALELGVPVALIGEAVFARCLSALLEERRRAARVLRGPAAPPGPPGGDLVEDVRRALYASKIVSYTQGYMLLAEAARAHRWHLNYGGIALMWRGGCIIRSRFLGRIKEAFDRDPALANLLLDGFFRDAVEECQAAWRRVVAHAALAGIPVPAFASALAFYDGYRRERLPASLLQAQRDYFGAHTYERVDRPRGEFFHTNWTGRGGAVSATTYGA
jgi:6-phosphogluconate dehydrogenase